MTNGHDLGDMGVKMRRDHTAEESFGRRVGCAILAALAVGFAVALVACGAGAAILWGS